MNNLATQYTNNIDISMLQLQQQQSYNQGNSLPPTQPQKQQQQQHQDGTNNQHSLVGIGVSGNNIISNGGGQTPNNVAPGTSINATNPLVAIAGLNFSDPATLATVLGQQQQAVLPALLQQQLLPLHHQLQQSGAPASAGDATSNNNLTIQQPDAQALWQQALQSLAGGQMTAVLPFGANASALTQPQQQQQQFQQLVASLPMPADLSQLAIMYPLQTQVQSGQQQPQQQVQVQPSQFQVQAAPNSQLMFADFTKGQSLNVLHSLKNNGTSVSTLGMGSSVANDNKKRKSAEDDSTTGNPKELKSGPSVVSYNSKCDFGFNEKPPERKSEAELEKMTESERRRYERNLREQQRSYKISQQIKELRDVLAESNIPFRPNKYSILVSVAEYIKQLQSRAIMLDAEHQRLIDTMRKTNEMIKSGTGLSLSDEDDNNNNGRFTSQLQSALESTASDLLLVQGIDYRSVFDLCPYPMGIATLDGRVLAANEGFEDLLCCAKGQMADQSLFVYIRNHQEIFEAMAALLKRSSLAVETGEGTCKDQQLLYWCGNVLSPRSQKVPFTITLTSTADNNPKYFSLSASSAIE